MRTLIITIVFIAINISWVGAQELLDSKLISDSLLIKSDAVYRFHKTTYERISKSKYRKKVHYAVTILNENGVKEGDLRISYDKTSNVTHIKGII